VAQQGSPGDGPALKALVRAVRQTPGVASVAVGQGGATGNLSVIDVVPTSAPQDKATSTLVTHLREDVIPAAERGTGLTVHVGGPTAASADLADIVTGKLSLFLAVIVGLGCLLLMIAFRSVLVPLTAAVMNLLASAASFGVVVAVFQWGWGSELLGLGKAGPVEAELPLIMLAILFGLSMDYQVFLVSRMHEEWEHTRDNHRAIRIGQAETGRLINAAALIMICVFTAFVFAGQRVIAEYGVGLAAAVAIDAFVLRTVLVPALMHLLGPANWWLPGWLDWILPRLSIESTPASGPALTAPAPASASAVPTVLADASVPPVVPVPASAAPAIPVPARVPPAVRAQARHHLVAETAAEPSTPVRPAVAPASRRGAGPGAPKSVGVAYLWWFFLGLFGGHHFYLGRTGRGLVDLFTIGFCGLGWLADGATLPRQVRSANARNAPRDVVPPTNATVGSDLHGSVR